MQYKRGRGGFGSDIFQDIRRAWTIGGGAVTELWCFGAKVRMQVLVRWHFAVNVCRCGDTFHPPEKWTLYLKVTPFDSNTPTHLRTKVPIGGICVAAKLPRPLALSLLIIISHSPLNCFALNINASQ